MIKKLSMKKFTDEQLEMAEKAAIKAGAEPVPGVCSEECGNGCRFATELYADNFIPLDNYMGTVDAGVE